VKSNERNYTRQVDFYRRATDDGAPRIELRSNMTDTPHTPQPARSKLRRIANVAAQVLLILITIGLIVAILLPVYVGPSKEKQRRDNPPGRRLTR
jgi:hypothetical protein